MKPKVMACIMKSLFDSEKEWEKEISDEEDVKLAAYLAGAIKILQIFGTVCNETLEKDDDSDEDLDEKTIINDYFSNALINFSENYRVQYAKQAFSENYEEALGLVVEIFRGYTNNSNLKQDEDDGIEGEESSARHWIFDSVIGALPLIREKTVDKNGVVRALRSCADYIEKLDILS